MTDIFERASKQKLRFTTKKGSLATEDLWELSLTSLDEVAKNIHAQLKTSEEVSFIKETTKADTELNLKMDILKHIIKVKLDAKEKAAVRAENQAKLEELQELYKDKSREELKSLSKEEIQARIDALKS